jgi:hypothetical protein
MTQIMVESEIMEPIDAWAKTHLPTKVHHGLFECHQCCGFWCGIILGPVLISSNPFTVVACGCAGSFLADLGALILDWLEGPHAHAEA